MRSSKGHIGTRALAAYLTESAIEGRREEIAEHILACPSCRARLETLALALAPRYRGKVGPSPDLKRRILASYDERAAGREAPQRVVPDSRQKAPSRRYGWLIPATVAAGFLALAAGGVLAWLTFFRPVPWQLAVKAASPGVTVGGAEALTGMPVRAGAAVVVPDEAALELAAGEALSIRLMPGSRFTLDLVEKEPRGPRVTLRARLEQGALISSAPRKGAVRYTYRTPHARVESLGTEFLLMDDGASTEIIMNSGSVTLVPAATGKPVTATPATRYLVTRTVERAAVTDDDRERFQSFVTRHEERIQAKPALERERDVKSDDDRARPSVRERLKDRGRERLTPRGQKRRDGVRVLKAGPRREGTRPLREVKRRERPEGPGIDEEKRPPRTEPRPPREVKRRESPEGPAVDDDKKQRRARPPARPERRERRERPHKKDR